MDIKGVRWEDSITNLQLRASTIIIYCTTDNSDTPALTVFTIVIE